MKLPIQSGNLLGGSCYFDFGDNRSYREPTSDSAVLR